VNQSAGWLLLVTVVVMGVDWYAVGSGRRRLELVAKPLALVALIAVALALDPADPTVRAWFVGALVFCLAGDVFLLDGDRWFVPGLAAFLVGHLGYVVGFWVAGVALPGAAVGAAVIAIAVATVGRPVVAAVRSGDEPQLAAPVTAYITVISLMVISAFGTGHPLAAAGASLFFLSDAVLAWNRFVQERRFGPLAIIVTYHLGQIGLVLSLR